MGTQRKATCRDCKAHITVDEGGGFLFHLLRCVRCGRANRIGLRELGDVHVRYLKGSERPYTVASSAEHEYIRQQVDVESMSPEDYFDAVEGFRKCDCGGRLSFDAPPRCPRCGSLEITLGEVTACYD